MLAESHWKQRMEGNFLMFDKKHSPNGGGRLFPFRTVGLLLLVLVLVIVPFLLFGEQVDGWIDRWLEQAETHRVQVAALLVFLLASDIVMPVPSSLISTACGMLLGFWGGTLASFSGMMVTTLVGYLIGRYAAVPAEKWIGKNETTMMREFHQRHGLGLLIAMRPVPVMAETSVVFAGLARLPFLPVIMVTVAGNLAVSMVYALVGAWGRAADAFLPAFGVSMLLSGGLMLWMRLRHRRGNSTDKPLEKERSCDVGTT